MHRVLSVVSMFSFEFSSMNVLLSFLAEQPLHLVICESEEWLHMTLGEEKLGSGRNIAPRVGCKLKWREQEMQSRWIALGRETCPFHQGIQADVYIEWP